MAYVSAGWRWATRLGDPSSDSIQILRLPADPIHYAAGLYAALHELEAAAVERIVVALPPDAPPWHTIHDRLRRASTPAD